MIVDLTHTISSTAGHILMCNTQLQSGEWFFAENGAEKLAQTFERMASSIFKNMKYNIQGYDDYNEYIILDTSTGLNPTNCGNYLLYKIHQKTGLKFNEYEYTSTKNIKYDLRYFQFIVKYFC